MLQGNIPDGKFLQAYIFRTLARNRRTFECGTQVDGAVEMQFRARGSSNSTSTGIMCCSVLDGCDFDFVAIMLQIMVMGQTSFTPSCVLVYKQQGFRVYWHKARKEFEQNSFTRCFCKLSPGRRALPIEYQYQYKHT